MSMHRMRAAMTGLLETTYVDEWVVTEKVGDHVKDKLEAPLLTPVKPTECVERYATRSTSTRSTQQVSFACHQHSEKKMCVSDPCFA
jgi:hypothetical protein